MDNPDLTHSARRINTLARSLGAKTYLEIGVERGSTFFGVDIERKYAVDPEFRFDPSTHRSAKANFFSGFSDDFFKSYRGGKFDVVFLDGLHRFEQTLRDFLNALTHAHDSTVILIDDVFPTDVFSALRDHGEAVSFRKLHKLDGQAWHGDVFKLIFFIHDFFPTLTYATIDDGWNRQTLVWKKPRLASQPRWNDIEKISRLNYFDLINNVDIMRLQSETESIRAAIDDITMTPPAHAAAPMRVGLEVAHVTNASAMQDVIARLKLTCLAECLKSILEQNGAGKVGVHPFQAEYSRTGRLVCLSPFDGSRVESTRSVLLPDKTTFFLFDAKPEFAVAASNTSQGYPLSAILFPSFGAMIKLDDTVWGIVERHCSILNGVLSRVSATPPMVAGDRVLLLTGDGNYAHFMWNQLPAVRSVLKTASPALPLELLVTHEPLGRIEDLLVGFGAVKIHRLNDYELPTATDFQCLSALAVGSTYADMEIRDAVVGHCTAKASVRARAVREQAETASARFWISIRTRNRTIVDQSRFLTDLCLDLLREFDGSVILLDGFSLPADIDVTNRYGVASMRRSAVADSEVARIIMDNVHRALGVPVDAAPGNRILDCTSFTIADSIFLAQAATAYFAHHGTVQHKVGWTTSCPGVVHANYAILDQCPDVWAASQVAGSRVPVYLPKDHVQDEADRPLANAQEERLRLQNYSILDPMRTRRFILDQFRRFPTHGL